MAKVLVSYLLSRSGFADIRSVDDIVFAVNLSVITNAPIALAPLQVWILDIQLPRRFIPDLQGLSNFLYIMHEMLLHRQS
jgi:hypothetical protein